MEIESPRYINPLIDFSFKKIFGEESNKELLIAFLNQLFQGRKKIVDLEYSKTEHPGESKDDRVVIFDVLCKGDHGEIFLIEMQRGQQKFFKKRAIYYASRQISGQSEKGHEWQYNFTEVYVIAILENFTLDGTRSSKYLHDIRLSDRESGRIFHEGYGFIFVELLNFTKSEYELETELDKWLYALKNMSRLTEIPAVFKENIFKRLFDTAEYINLTPMERTIYDIRQKIEWDNKNVHDFEIEEAKLKGEEMGKEVGKQKKALEMARMMKQDGFAIETIRKYTNLPVEEIESL